MRCPILPYSKAEKDMFVKSLVSIFALTGFALTACSPQSEGTAESENGAASSASSAPADERAAGPVQLTSAGLGDLKIGDPVPAGSSWSVPDTNTGQGCVTTRSSEYKGVYAILEKGKVERITLRTDSSVKLAGGVGIGAREEEVKRQFPGLHEEVHKYDTAPAKYLTSPDASPTKSGLRFEIKADGSVGLIHAGRTPVLTYVEGCG